MDLPDPGIKLGSPILQADSLPTELCDLGQVVFNLSVKIAHLNFLPYKNKDNNLWEIRIIILWKQSTSRV